MFDGGRHRRCHRTAALIAGSWMKKAPKLGRWLAVFAALIPLTVLGERNSPHVNYMLHCQGCHLPGGIGHPGIVPTMKDSVGQFLNVDGGRKYLVQVPGVSQSSLDNEALAEVLNWMIPAFDPAHTPTDFEPYTASEVARYRATKIRNVSEIRARLLQRLADNTSD